MAVPQSYRYGRTAVETPSVQEFIDGVMARDDELIRRAGKMFLAGAGTALAVTAYRNWRR